ncbi:uncharacterized protein LOC128962263 [Oppia nitens]|uniref:uncharacterized protein LOC128962263 n=1 Tax=Oppia nitens TaxID=1686743 RepID=UPI0023DA4931|nr:uncharacterized protein LOC128962263 [Oppia nitens]
MSSEYNLLREAFIRGHNGSTIGEILAITSVNQLTNFLMIAILSLIPILTEPKLQWIRYTIEFFIIMVPFALSVTILSDYNHLIYIAIIVLTFIAIILCVVKRRPKEIVIKDLLDLRLNYKNRLPFVSNLFSTLMQCVCISILAVDFHAFPRRFAKTEIYGYSLMDVGVGAFIAINGGFSPEARLGSDHHFQRFFLFKKTLFSTIPLIILGFQRLIAVKSLEYHEHITEYGLHWNFFFTLAITKTISTLFFILFSTKVNIGFCGIVVIIVYQLCLNCGLNEFIQNDNRIGLFAANKEDMKSKYGLRFH